MYDFGLTDIAWSSSNPGKFPESSVNCSMINITFTFRTNKKEN